MLIRKSHFGLAMLLTALQPMGLNAKMGLNAQTAGDLPPVVHLTSEQDHQRTMDLLKMTSIRQGRNGTNPQDPNYANYDESKANVWTNYPDALVLLGHDIEIAVLLRRRADHLPVHRRHHLRHAAVDLAVEQLHDLRSPHIPPHLRTLHRLAIVQPPARAKAQGE